MGRGDLEPRFPALRLVSDWFCVYQRPAHAGREKNRAVTQSLTQLDVREFGDAISAPR